MTVKDGVSVQIGNATLHVKKSKKGSVEIAIDAPPEVEIVRSDAKKKGPKK